MEYVNSIFVTFAHDGTGLVPAVDCAIECRLFNFQMEMCKPESVLRAPHKRDSLIVLIAIL